MMIARQDDTYWSAITANDSTHVTASRVCQHSAGRVVS